MSSSHVMHVVWLRQQSVTITMIWAADSCLTMVCSLYNQRILYALPRATKKARCSNRSCWAGVRGCLDFVGCLAFWGCFLFLSCLCFWGRPYFRSLFIFEVVFISEHVLIFGGVCIFGVFFVFEVVFIFGGNLIFDVIFQNSQFLSHRGPWHQKMPSKCSYVFQRWVELCDVSSECVIG